MKINRVSAKDTTKLIFNSFVVIGEYEDLRTENKKTKEKVCIHTFTYVIRCCVTCSFYITCYSRYFGFFILVTTVYKGFCHWVFSM